MARPNLKFESQSAGLSKIGKPMWFLDVDGVINSLAIPSPYDPIGHGSYVVTEFMVPRLNAAITCGC